MFQDSALAAVAGMFETTDMLRCLHGPQSEQMEILKIKLRPRKNKDCGEILTVDNIGGQRVKGICRKCKIPHYFIHTT